MRFWKLFPLCLVLLSGCSLRDRSDFRGVQLSLPAQLVSAAKLRKNSLYTALVNPSPSPIVSPTSIFDFQCFAINVTGPGILKDPRFSCGSIPSEVGISAGLFPVNQSQLDVMVPIGANRKIQLIGMQSTAGCPDFNTIFKNKLFDTESFGQAYVLGEVTVDVFDDTAATLIAAFDSSKIFMPACAQQEPVLPPTCLAGQHWNDVTGACDNNCAPGTSWNSIYQQCEGVCSYGQNWDFAIHACSCPVGTNFNGTACVVDLNNCNGTDLFDVATNSCLPNLSCELGEFLVGANIQSGEVIDGYRIKCASYSEGPIGLTVERNSTGNYGGYGGGASSFDCPANSLLSKISTKVHYGFYYGAAERMELTCKNTSHSVITTEDLSSKHVFGGGSAEETFTCPAGQFAYGIKAMQSVTPSGGLFSGQIIDILCRPLPTTQGGGGGVTISEGTESGVGPAIVVPPAVPVVTP